MKVSNHLKILTITVYISYDSCPEHNIMQGILATPFLCTYTYHTSLERYHSQDPNDVCQLRIKSQV